MNWTKLLEVLFVVGLTSTGQLLLRLGMRQDGNTEQGLLDLIRHLIQTPILWLALGFYAVSTLLWMRVLARYPVGSVYPMVALGYVFVTAGGILFLGERVPLQGWLALAIICTGTLLLAATNW